VIVPLTYGLRAMRKMLLDHASFASVAPDVGILAGITVVLLAAAAWSYGAAMQYARRAGSLAQY
jgi:ABC-type polysaccharide/polyol phosphate export permease